MLFEFFREHASLYSSDQKTIESLWREIANAYGRGNRHYHSLSHLEQMVAHLIPLRQRIADWHAMVFAVFYHDIVYNVLKGNNEERSASLATRRLKELKVSDDKIQQCRKLIIATKHHLKSDDEDVNFFLDADLVILGMDWPVYMDYFLKVRKEYSVFPDVLFRKGRRQVLMHFLGLERIFKQHEFHFRYENQARENLGRELEYWNGTRSL